MIAGLGRLLLCVALLTALLGPISVAGPAAAQGSNAALWEANAERAETALEAETTSDAVLDAVRARLSADRSAALEQQDTNAARLETLQAELAALGPAPEAGVVEAADIAAARAELNEKITAARAPALVAEAAYQRADGLIREIDGVLRARLSARLSHRVASPLWPSSWTQAVEGLGKLRTNVQSSFATLRTVPSRQERMNDGLPLLVISLLGAILLMTFVRRAVIGGIVENLDKARGPALRAGLTFVLNLARLLIPYAAAIAVITALVEISPGGRILDSLGAALPLAATALVAGFWLSRTVFSADRPQFAVLPRVPKLARRGEVMALLLGALVAVYFLVEATADTRLVTEAARGVLLLPLLLLGSFALYRLAGALTRITEEDASRSAIPAAPVTLIGRVAFAVACVTPLAALFGYINFAEFLFVRATVSLGLIGLFVVVFSVFSDSIDLWLSGEGDETRRDARARFRLLPVLIGFALASVAIPLLVLIWGARATDLEEVWQALQDGVSIGESRISVSDFMVFVLIFVAGYTLTRMLQTVMRTSVLPRTDIDVGGRNAIVTGLGYVGITLAALIAINSTGLNLSNVAIVAGALSVGIGFGLQTIVSNFVSGIILLIERPIKEGDWIEVAGYQGYVSRISVRSTMIQTFDRSSVIVPNQELIAGTVLNYTHDNLMGRVIVPVGVAYGTDIEAVTEILRDIATDHPQVLRTPAPSVIFQGFGADSLDFEIRAFLRDVNYVLSTRSEMNFEIYNRFVAAGIEIPFRQSDVTIRNLDEVAALLRPGQEDKT